MSMKKRMIFLAGLLAVLLASCDTVYQFKTVESRLRGTWKSTVTNTYSGELEIDLDTITITGYDQTPWPSNENERPFKGFAKNAPLECYTEDGNKLFITTVGGEKIVSYRYYAKNSGRYLYFDFGGRAEALKRVEE